MGLLNRNTAGYFDDIQPPSGEELAVFLKHLVSVGQISPQDAQTYQQNPSAFLDIVEDPKTRQAQLDVMGGLQETIDAGGLDAQAQASLNQAQMSADVNSRGNQEAIIANAAARGVAGSGMEMAARMNAQQGAAQQASARGFNEAALAEQRRMAALQGLGAQSSQLRGQDQAIAAQTASASDAINRFNTANQQSQENRNVGAANQAQQYNQGNRQRVADTNVGLDNQSAMFNSQAQDRAFNMELAKAGGQAGAAQADNATTMGIISGAMNVGGSLLGNVPSDMRVKENVEEFSPSELLDDLAPLKYNYTDDQYGQGPQTGVSAQQLEQIAPQAVSQDGDGVRRIDTQKMMMPLLAALSDLAGRVKTLEVPRG